jgi:polyribonucleotide nucleotidyltransferase
MNIKSPKYIKNIITNVNDNIKAIIDEQEMSVPLDPDNRHYQAILEWAKIDGNTIAEAD